MATPPFADVEPYQLPIQSYLRSDSQLSNLNSGTDFDVPSFGPQPRTTNYLKTGGLENVSDYSRDTGMRTALDPSLLESGVGSTEQKAGDVAKVASAGLAFVPAIGPILSGISAIAGTVLDYYGQKRQEAAQKQAYDDQMRLIEQQRAEDTRRYNIETGQRNRELDITAASAAASRDIAGRKQAESEQETAEDIKVKNWQMANTEKQQAMTAWMNMLANMTRMYNTPQAKHAMNQIWGS